MGDSARTVTELYQALRPLILRDVAAVAAPAAAGGGMAAHALNGPFHSGSLAEVRLRGRRRRWNWWRTRRCRMCTIRAAMRLWAVTTRRAG